MSNSAAIRWPWSELGLAGPSDRKGIKRAYAQHLKALDQSADPDGFQRLRLAYERALSLATMTGTATPTTPPEAEQPTEEARVEPTRAVEEPQPITPVEVIEADPPSPPAEDVITLTADEAADTQPEPVAPRKRSAQERLEDILRGDGQGNPWQTTGKYGFDRRLGEVRRILDSPEMADPEFAAEAERWIFNDLIKRTRAGQFNTVAIDRELCEGLDRHFGWGRDYRQLTRQFGHGHDVVHLQTLLSRKQTMPEGTNWQRAQPQSIGKRRFVRVPFATWLAPLALLMMGLGSIDQLEGKPVGALLVWGGIVLLGFLGSVIVYVALVALVTWRQEHWRMAIADIAALPRRSREQLWWQITLEAVARLALWAFVLASIGLGLVSRLSLVADLDRPGLEWALSPLSLLVLGAVVSTFAPLVKVVHDALVIKHWLVSRWRDTYALITALPSKTLEQQRKLTTWGTFLRPLLWIFTALVVFVGVLSRFDVIGGVGHSGYEDYSSSVFLVLSLFLLSAFAPLVRVVPDVVVLAYWLKRRFGRN